MSGRPREAMTRSHGKAAGRYVKAGRTKSFRCSDIHERIIDAAVKGRSFLKAKKEKAASEQSDEDNRESPQSPFSEFIRGAGLRESLSVKEELEDLLKRNRGEVDDDELDVVMRLLDELDPVTSMLNELVTSLDRLLGGLMSGGRRKHRWVVGVRRGIERARMELQHARAALGRLEALEAAERAEGGGNDVAKRLAEERVALSVMLDNMLISTEDLSGMFRPGGRRDARWATGVGGELKNIRMELGRVRQLDRRLQELEEKQRAEDLKKKEKPPEAVVPDSDSGAECSLDLV